MTTHAPRGEGATLPAPLLEGTMRSYEIDTLVNASSCFEVAVQVPNERRLLNFILPPWQRPEVWDVAKKRRFVEGIFLGLGCGYLVANGRDWNEDGNLRPMSGWLIDGQQRLTALRDFIDGELTIFDGIRLQDLDRPTQLRRFWRASFPQFELDYTEDEALLQDLYDRLNFGGVAHTAADRAPLHLLDR